MSEAKPTTANARVLIDCTLEGVDYKCNQVVDIDKDIIKTHKEYLDDNKKGVEYCLKEGAKVIKHAKPEAAPAEKPAE